MTRISDIPSSDNDLGSHNHAPKRYLDKSSNKEVAILLNGDRLKEPISATYKRINFDNGSVSYVLNDKDNTSKYINFGNVTKKDSNEYFIAYVNKRTKDVLYKPACLVKIQPQIIEDKDKFLNGKIVKGTKVDYKNSNSINKEDFLGKRNALTVDFGSIKKRKMLDDSFRRNVDHDTMVALADTAFASNTNVDEKPNLNQSGVEAITAISGATQGEVAPTYNPEGKKPLEIWPIEQFIEDSTYDIVVEKCLEFFKDKSFDDLIEFGFPKLVAELAQSYIGDGDVSRRSVSTIDLKEIPCSIVPEVLVAQVNSEFFDLSNITRRGFIRYNVSTKDKLASHILILYMLLNVPSHSIYVNIASKQFHISEVQIVKYLTKLGCIVNKASNEEEIKYGATRVGVIKNVPGSKTFSLRKKR